MSRKRREPTVSYQRPISARNRQIYFEVTVAKRSQREVAQEFRISQARVSKIVARVFGKLSAASLDGLSAPPLAGVARPVARHYDDPLHKVLLLTSTNVLDELIDLGKRAEREKQARLERPNKDAETAKLGESGAGSVEDHQRYYSDHANNIDDNSPEILEPLLRSPTSLSPPPFGAI